MYNLYYIYFKYIYNFKNYINEMIYFVSYGYISSRKTKGYVLSISCPCTTIDSPSRFVFLHSFLFRRPKGNV